MKGRGGGGRSPGRRGSLPFDERNLPLIEPFRGKVDFPLVLASSSPRRAGILRGLGFSIVVDPPHVSEEPIWGEEPRVHAERLAREKVEVVWERHPGAFVVGGDTVVVLGGKILGKPCNPDEAEEMLLALAGRTHTVVSGLAVAFPEGTLRSGADTARVTFRSFGPAVARAYVATGEPMDKAGSYGIQGWGASLVRKIEGDYHTVVGLPLALFLDLLEAEGWCYTFRGLERGLPAAGEEGEKTGGRP